MKIRKDFVLRQMSDYFLVVAIGPASRTFNGVIQLNESGALLWRELEKGASETELEDALLRQYPDARRDQVREAVKEFLETVSMATEP